MFHDRHLIHINSSPFNHFTISIYSFFQAIYKDISNPIQFKILRSFIAS